LWFLFALFPLPRNPGSTKNHATELRGGFRKYSIANLPPSKVSLPTIYLGGIFMQWYPLPDWMKPALEQRFFEQARAASQQPELEEEHQKQEELTNRLRSQLSDTQFQLIMELEAILNYRNALEKNYLYLDGIRDGFRILLKILNVDMTDE
jgi:hypothetical protein